MSRPAIIAEAREFCAKREKRFKYSAAVKYLVRRLLFAERRIQRLERLLEKNGSEQ